MNQTLKDRVNNSPLKKKFIAKELAINPSDLSRALKGMAYLSADKEEKLKQLLKMVD